jgi:hypothetical protein
MPSVGVPKYSTAPTTPLPRLSTGLPPVPAQRARSATVALVTWLLVMGALLGGGGYLAYRKGLIFAQVPTDTTQHADSVRPVDSVLAADSFPASGHDSGLRSVPAGTPGRLLLAGAIPADAHVTMDGQTVRGTQLDLPPGTHKLAVRAAGYANYERQVLVAPGGTATVAIELQKSRVIPAGDESGGAGGAGGDASSCDRFGPSYNQDNVCFDTRPAPLSAPYIFLPADATETPRLAILLVKVSREGTTLETRVFMASNVATFTTQALDFAKQLHWTPAQKDGEPVVAWTQLQVLPQRQ